MSQASTKQLVQRVLFGIGLTSILVAVVVGLVHAVSVEHRLPAVRPPSYFHNVESMLANEKYVRAIDQLWLAIAMQPRDGDIKRLLEAIASARETKKLDPLQCDEYEAKAWKTLLRINAQALVSAEVFFKLGSAQLRIGNSELSAARSNIERAIQLRPRFPQALANLARVLIRMDKRGLAGRHLQAARSMDPNLPLVRLAQQEYEGRLGP